MVLVAVVRICKDEGVYDCCCWWYVISVVVVRICNDDDDGRGW